MSDSRPGLREGVISIGELGEFGLIAAITDRMAAVSVPATGAPGRAARGLILLGSGDDAAVIGAPDRRVVATADMMIEGRHFRREWSSAADIGHKAAARNLADVAAMGAVPTALLVCFAGPPALEVDWVLDLAGGIAAECARVGAQVAGGDTSSAGSVLIAITALGDLAGRSPVTRSGARPGDLVAIAGQLGGAAAGLDLLRAGLSPPEADAGGSAAVRARTGADGPSGPVSVASADGGGGPVGAGAGADAAAVEGLLGGLVWAHRRPMPPYGAGPEAAGLGATSMIDVSDGLVADLGHVATASGVRIELDSAPLGTQPIAQVAALRQAAAYLSSHRDGGRDGGGRDGGGRDGGGSRRDEAGQGEFDWLRWVLTGGDDHALVATFPPGVALSAIWTVVGTVANGHGVAIDGQIWSQAGGWEHFRP